MIVLRVCMRVRKVLHVRDLTTAKYVFMAANYKVPLMSTVCINACMYASLRYAYHACYM